MNRWAGFFKIQIFACLFMLFPGAVLAQQSPSYRPGTVKDAYLAAESEWGLLWGYGASHPGWGKTRTRVQTVDMVYRYGLFLSGETGKSWYRGRSQLVVEVPFSYVHNPETGFMIGVNFLACRHFTGPEKVVPYLFIGGGPVYTELDIPGLGTNFNGNYQAGAGLRFFVSETMSVDLNGRYHHISNSGRAEPNVPLNSTKIFLGISFYR